MESSEARARHWEPEPGNLELGRRHLGLLPWVISDRGTLPRAAVDPPSLDVSKKAGWEPTWEKTKLLGSVSGCAWLNVSGQEVWRRCLTVLPASPSGEWGFRLWMFGGSKHLLAGRGL